MTLQTKQVGQYTVSQSNIRSVLLRNKLVEKVNEIMAKTPDLPDYEKEVYQTYCMIASCTTPMFTISEYLDMDEATVIELMNAFSELNAHLVGAPVNDETEKKIEN